MSHSRTALLVIDAQQSFEHRPYWDPSDAPAFHERLQSLIDGARARQIPVAQIFHVEESGAFSLESGYVRAMARIVRCAGRPRSTSIVTAHSSAADYRCG